MKNKWQLLEQNSYEYLISKINDCFGFTFNIYKEGNLNSNTSDIKISKDNNLITYIEVKSHTSQAAQFVLTFNDGKYDFSLKNKCNRKYCQPIIDYLNEHINEYSDISSKGLLIPINPTTSYKRIIDYYKNEKNVDFIITDVDSKMILFEVENIKNYFHVFCNIRRKKSGSRKISKKYIDDLIAYIKNKYDIDKYEIISNHLYVNSSKIIKNVYFSFSKFNCFLSLKDSNVNNYKYEARMLSNTNNINVIFTLISKCNTNDDFNKLINLLKSYV